MPRKGISAWRGMLLALPLLYMGLIFRLSSIPGGAVSISLSDKLLHTVEYAGFSFLLYVAMRYGLRMSVRQATLWAVVVAVLYGASDEFHQSFVPGRDASLWDLAADVGGALLAQAFLALWRSLQRRCEVSA